MPQKKKQNKKKGGGRGRGNQKRNGPKGKKAQPKQKLRPKAKAVKKSGNDEEKKENDSFQIRGMELIPLEQYKECGQTFPPSRTVSELWDGKKYEVNQTMPHPNNGKLFVHFLFSPIRYPHFSAESHDRNETMCCLQSAEWSPMSARQWRVKHCFRANYRASAKPQKYTAKLGMQHSTLSVRE